MPLIYIHGVRHREPDKLKGMERKLIDVVDGLRPAVPSIGETFQVRVPYWGEFGAPLRVQGLQPLDAPRSRSPSGRERLESTSCIEEPLEMLREACLDDPDRMRALLEDELGAESLGPRERADVEALLGADWQEIYFQARDSSAAATVPPLANKSGNELGLERADEESAPRPPRDLVRKRDAAQSLLDLVERTASKLVFDNQAARTWMRGAQGNCALFLGDAMTYVMQREAKGADSPILRTILAALPKPGQQREPLIVMTHSMGASILYDILTVFRPDLRVDCWISVGSQVGQFASLGLLAKQEALPDGARISGLSPRVSRWYNVFDRLDFLNYLTEPAFTDVKDIEYSNARGPLVSHSWYFKEQPFWDLILKLMADSFAGQTAIGRDA